MEKEAITLFFFYVFLNNWVVFKLVDGFLVDVRAFPSKKKKIEGKALGTRLSGVQMDTSNILLGGGG